MSEIPKAYEPRSVESKWSQFWLEHKCFIADPARVSEKRPAYSIVIPPPNVTGVLTMGHVLNNTVQDILARKARMDGKEVLWLPGTDHAGIATQTVVERTLKKAGEIKHRNDLGREKLLERIWEWKEKHGGIIIQQLKRLGASCDWTRERFTMDPEYSRCVQKVFVDLYKKGLIYRGKRMVNWCPASLTALSDEEVVMKQQNGLLYYFRVEVAEEAGTFLTIATTRPETIPGDTAVAVNPRDPRYAQFIGKHVVRPLPAELPREQKLIPIIGDEHVDFEFGTGVLKVTPAHDKADFEIYQRLCEKILKKNENDLLPDIKGPIEVIKADGTMSEAAGADLSGLDRFKARKVAAEKLAELGLLEREERYTNNVGFSERADVPVEPRLSEQWFLQYPSKSASRAVATEGQMKFFPERWAKVYDHWMANLQDWCISRQLWWGHRIPVWTKIYRSELEMPEAILDAILHDAECSVSGLAGRSSYVRSERTVAETWIVCAATYFDEEAAALGRLGFTQDPDVLDTWFSSWLWPFATMSWTGNPETDSKNPTLTAFYPTTDLVTGPDIIFFWVARMIIAGYEYMGEMPFRNVYFTGIIRDKQGRKMSKSLGNSPDPLDLIDTYGADALRFGVMRSAPLGQDVLYDEQHVELGRNFCNKLWNACRFRQMQGGETEGEIDPELLTSDDRWILLKLDSAIREISNSLLEYKFNEAAQALYRFFWSEFCDWYLEASKAVFFGNDPGRKANTSSVLDFVLSNTLRLFHPFLPFITEELWRGLGYNEDLPTDQGGETIMFARWPQPFGDDFKGHYGLDESIVRFVDAKYELVGQGRNLRREGNISSSKKVNFVLKPAQELSAYEAQVLKILLNAERLDIDSEFQPRKGTPAVRSPLGELYLPLEGLIDIAAEKGRLNKELSKIDAEIEKVKQKLGNPAFAQKVPPTVLEEHHHRLTEWETKRQGVHASLGALGES